MRVLVDLSSNDILQVERSPEIGDTTKINGKYAIEVPLGSLDVDTSYYVLPVDGGDITSLAYEELLARYPQFEFVAFNPLLEASDVADFDFTAVLDNTSNQVLSAPYTGTFSVRAQTGRGSGADVGVSPFSTAVLTPNEQTSPPRPGLLITDTIDISAATGGNGAQDFLVYWKVHQIDTSADILSDYGTLSGTNSPAIRSQTEIAQEPSGFSVAISFDDGSTYTPVGLLQSISHCTTTTTLRLAFANTSPDKVYLATYAILF